MKRIISFLIKFFKDLAKKELHKPKLEVLVPSKKARYDIGPPPKKSLPYEGLVWHHSFSPDKATRDWGGIEWYHTSYRIDFNVVSKQEFETRKKAGQGTYFQKPWKAVGYNAGTELIHGKPYFHPGRPLWMSGAHAGVRDVSNEFNQKYLGFCSIGNFDAISPNPNLWDLNLRVTRSFMDAYGFGADKVIGHREVYERLGVPPQKSCPGKSWNMDLFRKEL